MMDKKNRKRDTNFTNVEVELLLHLCNNNKNILENKTTNGVTWKEKNLAWEKIHTEFNSGTKEPSRTIKTLRSKYDSMKKEKRKSVARQRKYVTGTGEGPFKGEEKMSPALEQLHQNIKISSVWSLTKEITDKLPTTNTSLLEKTEEITDKLPTTNTPLLEKTGSSEQTRLHLQEATLSGVATKYNDLCTSKAELIQKELQVIEKKERQDTIEHELRVKKTKLEIEKLELELLLLKKSIQS